MSALQTDGLLQDCVSQRWGYRMMLFALGLNANTFISHLKVPIFCIAAFIVMVISVVGASASERACDELAAFPFDPARRSPGVAYENLNPSKALPACALATQQNPTSGLLWFQYGRALERANLTNPAIDAYTKARDLRHPGGANNLGELFRQGKGVPKDVFRAENLFRESAAAGYPEGAFNLAVLLLSKSSSDKQAVTLLEQASAAGYPAATIRLAQLPKTRIGADTPAITPAAGSPLRRNIMDALRPEVAAKLLSPIEFAVKTIRVADGWAFVRVMPQRPGGAKINIRQTPMAKYVEMMDGVRTEAFLRLHEGEWHVVDLGIGTTDVWYEAWCKKVPRSIMMDEDGTNYCFD